jgi:4-aminobutyrate aminotransferase-like enzyme
MTGSRRHTPIFGITGDNSEKQDKRRANRKFRRINRTREEPIIIEEAMDVYSMAKDGKRYIKKPEKKWMRK